MKILADINEIPSYDTRALFQPDYLWSKCFPFFIYLYKIPSKVWKGEKAPFLFWHDILGPHFTPCVQCRGMLSIHSFHVSCQCYFLCSFIRLSNKLMVFQLHSAAAQRAGSVTAHIWCNLRVDKWEAEFPGCEGYGCSSVQTGPGRAPLFGCQVAPGQVCGGAAQSAPSNWNVDQGAGIAPCLFSNRRAHKTCMSTRTQRGTFF